MISGIENLLEHHGCSKGKDADTQSVSQSASKRGLSSTNDRSKPAMKANGTDVTATAMLTSYYASSMDATLLREIDTSRLLLFDKS